MRFNFEVRYQLDFYRTDDGSGAWYSSQFVSSSLLGTLSPAYPGTYYDFAFKASKSGVTFRDIPHLSVVSELRSFYLKC
jgi:hypothetical protein